MIKRGWCRKVVNDMVHRTKRVFRGGVENELPSPNVYHGLQAASSLKKGRSGRGKRHRSSPSWRR